MLCRRYSSSRTSSRVVAPRASALLLLMHVNNNVSSTHMFNVVLHALSSFIICISSSRSSSTMSSRASAEHHRRRACRPSSTSGHQQSARYCLLNPLLMNPAAWPKYFCAQNVFFYTNYRTIGRRTHQQHNKDKGIKQYPAPARQRPSYVGHVNANNRLRAVPSVLTTSAVSRIT